MVDTTEKLQKSAIDILNMDRGDLGARVYQNVISPESGDFVEMGDDLRAVIREAKTGAMHPLEAVEKTLIAISGSGFSSTAGTN